MARGGDLGMLAADGSKALTDAVLLLSPKGSTAAAVKEEEAEIAVTKPA